MSGRGFWTKGVVNPVTANGDTSFLKLPKQWQFNNDGPGVIFAHGRGGQSNQLLTNPYQHVDALVSAGYAVLGVDLTGLYAYGHPSAVQTFLEGHDYLINTVKVRAPGGKVGALGWSMGGLSALNYAIRNAGQLAGAQLWSPLIDLDWAHGAAATGWTSGWTLASQIATAASEIDTAYTNLGANQGTATTTATGLVTIPASGGAGVNVPLTTTINFADPTTKGSDARSSRCIVNSVACTYTGISGSSLTGVVSTTASTVAVVNGTVVSTNYTNNSPGYDPMKRRADYASLAVPMMFIHASDDATIPAAQTTWFQQVNSGQFTLRAAPTGGHSGQFFNVPARETVAFFNGLSY